MEMMDREVQSLEAIEKLLNSLPRYNLGNKAAVIRSLGNAVASGQEKQSDS